MDFQEKGTPHESGVPYHFYEFNLNGGYLSVSPNMYEFTRSFQRSNPFTISKMPCGYLPVKSTANCANTPRMMLKNERK